MRHLLKWTLIKKNLGILLVTFSLPLWSEQTVPSSETTLKPSAEFRAFKRTENWDHLFEIRWAPDEHSNFRTVTLSSRYKYPHNIMFGAYIRRAWGERHFHNWVKDSESGAWEWEDVDSETETHIGVMAQKKWLLSETLSLEVRTSYEHHQENDLDLVRLRPGLTWLAHPSWVTYARYEMYIPPNIEMTSIYKQGLYLGALYTAKPPFLFGPFLRWEQKTWWSSPQFAQIKNDTYRVKDSTISTGISFVYNF